MGSAASLRLVPRWPRRSSVVVPATQGRITAQEKFRLCDHDRDGSISREDLGRAMQGQGMREEEIDMIFRSADAEGTGLIGYDGFVEWLYDVLPDPVGPAALTPTVDIPSVVRPGSLGIVLYGARNVPKMDYFSESDPYVVLDVTAADGTILAKERSICIPNSANPTWHQVLSLPPAPQGKVQAGAGAGAPAAGWDASSAVLSLRLMDQDMLFDDFIGQCSLPVLDLAEHPSVRLAVWSKAGEAVLASSPPHMPCEVTLAVVQETIPPAWPPSECPRTGDSYPYHVFMMTRGTRGDVQPFVALARGMANQRGWLVTICTELRWKGFVKANAGVSRGRIRFRPSGGDTEARMDSWIGKLVLESRSDLMQMVVMACSEAEFFGSATMFLSHVLQMENSGPRPVDLLVFGLTVARVAALISELCDKALIGFILQPSIIPSSDAEWSAIQPVRKASSKSLPSAPGSGGRSSIFTSHNALRFMKGVVEESGLGMYNLHHLRTSFGLEVTDTWDTMKRKNVPLVIPMRDGTFPRPSDWWENIHLTDFIFLRSSDGATASSLHEPLKGFVAQAREAGAKLGLMTFSSMPVARQLVVACSVRMVEECNHNLGLILVGRLQGDNSVPGDLAARANTLRAEGRFCEVEKADFGVLFKEMDCFIVHGGLGTTVEALRCQKPVCVTGPLLMDQRFWGNVCHQKGVGPEPVMIEDFEKTCVDFVNCALDPADPRHWQANARSQYWGEESDDGVQANVSHFAWLAGQKLTTLTVRDLSAALGPCGTRDTLRSQTLRELQQGITAGSSAPTTVATGPPLA